MAFAGLLAPKTISVRKHSRFARPVSKNAAKPYVLVTRKRPTREHNFYTESMRNERLRQEKSFLLFRTEIPEATAVAEALGKAAAPKFLDLASMKATRRRG